MSVDPTINKKIRISAITTCVFAVVFAYLGNRYGETLISYGGSYFEHFDVALFNMFSAIANNPLHIDLSTISLLIGLACAVVVLVVWLRYITFIGNYRAGEESGSARWGTLKEGVKFKDKKNKQNNLIFTKNYGLAITLDKHDIEFERNLNVLLVGGSGSGKTFRYVLPNICQLNTNYFITDPKGTLIKDAGFLFSENGYKIKSFNTIEFSESMHYNPLAYVKTDTDILSFVNCFIKNTNGDKQGGDAFWENAERMLYTALIALLRDWFPASAFTLPNVLALLSLAEVREHDEKFMSSLDLIFNEIETGKRLVKCKEVVTVEQEIDDVIPSVAPAQSQEDTKSHVLTRGFNESKFFQEKTTSILDFEQDVPVKKKKEVSEERIVDKWLPSNMCRNSDGVRPATCGGLPPTKDFALLNYKNFKVAAGKTLKSIIISCNVRLAPIATQGVSDLLSYDEMKLDKLGDKEEKTVIFGILSDTDKTLSFLFAIMMWQAIDQLCRRALDKYNGKLPTPVHFIFDEFANIGTIPDIEQTIAVTRSRNIGISIILQSVSQLTSQYDKKAQTIIDCCDTTVFLGGKSNSTNKEIAEMIGKQTINQMTYGASGAGLNLSGSKNMQIQGRDLIDPAEIGKMSRKKAIVLIAGANPLQDDKYETEKHPMYKFVVNTSDKNAMHKEPFDFTKYLEDVREARKKQEEENEHKQASKKEKKG